MRSVLGWPPSTSFVTHSTMSGGLTPPALTLSESRRRPSSARKPQLVGTRLPMLPRTLQKHSFVATFANGRRCHFPRRSTCQLSPCPTSSPTLLSTSCQTLPERLRNRGSRPRARPKLRQPAEQRARPPHWRNSTPAGPRSRRNRSPRPHLPRCRD